MLDHVDTRGKIAPFFARCPAPPSLGSTTPRPPPPRCRPKAHLWWPERLPAPKVFTDTWQSVSGPGRCLLPKPMSLERWIFVAVTVAESRSDHFRVPLCLGRNTRIGRNKAKALTRERGPPAMPPPCPVARGIFSSFLRQRLSWSRARMTGSAVQRRVSRGTSFLLTFTDRWMWRP